MCTDPKLTYYYKVAGNHEACWEDKHDQQLVNGHVEGNTAFHIETVVQRQVVRAVVVRYLTGVLNDKEQTSICFIIKFMPGKEIAIFQILPLLERQVLTRAMIIPR